MTINCNFVPEVAIICQFCYLICGKPYQKAWKCLQSNILYFIWNLVKQAEQLFNWFYYHVMAITCQFNYLICGEPYQKAWKRLHISPILHVNKVEQAEQLFNWFYYHIIAIKCNFVPEKAMICQFHYLICGKPFWKAWKCHQSNVLYFK